VVKVLHLNTYEANGGAGKAAERLNLALKAEGVDSRLAVNFTFVKNSDADSFASNPVSKAYSLACMLAERLCTKQFVKKNGVPFSTSLAGRDISKHRWVREADLIHIHWINHGFLSLPNLASLFRLGKPVVYTVHDSYPFTGGCHVRYGCEKYLEQCGDCPDLLKPGPDDESHHNWKAKAEVYNLNPFTVVAPSRWMTERAKASSLFTSHPVRHIANCLDTRLFLPLNKASLRTAFAIAEDRSVILAGYMPSRAARHKGGRYLWEMLKILSESNIASSLEVLLIGHKAGGQGDDLPALNFPIRSLGVLNTDEALAQAYAVSDVYVTSSLEESLGYTAIESMACGTPVAAFNTSGLLDVVDHRKNGYLAQLGSARDLAEGVRWILETPARMELSLSARRKAVASFAAPVVAGQHISLYNELLSGR